MLSERERIAAWYDAHLADIPGLHRYRPPAGLQGNVYKYVALLNHDVDRFALKKRLRSSHKVVLPSEVYEVLLCDQPVFREAFARQSYPRARQFAERHICLPVFPTMTTTQQQRVVAALRCELS